ncbi:MAG: hypothetical protein GKR91_12765 [Pseudomonadales bacterium]|nr:hypothetical protein [Pseudomonadales bacterium]
MNELLEKIWSISLDLDDSPSDELTDLIDEAQEQNQSDDLSEALFSCAKCDDLDKLVYILNASAWCGSDNGAALQRTLELWLYGANENKIYVALNVETYPFRDKVEMEKCLIEIQTKYPQFGEKCESLINSRNKLTENT